MERPSELIKLRNHRPGDMTYIAHRHAVVYYADYGFENLFESHMSRYTAHFLDNFDPSSERCWIAEREGQFLGCIMLTKDREVPGRARIRCFFVEKTTRGLGIGTTLIETCLAFAKEVGYERVGLQTYRELSGARRLYAKFGFQILKTEEEREEWGRKRVSEIWELLL